MFIQIKAIRKGTKPPVWRRAYVPLGITFAQMAYILEVLLELPVTDQYEFEFFQEKDRLVEGDLADFKKSSGQFRYRNAVKASVDDWSENQTWFTFRVADDNGDLPQYRVEIENKADILKKVSEGKEEKVPLPYPLLVKARSYKGDRYWTDPKAISQKLKDLCQITEGKAEYPPFASVCERVEQGKGIVICPGLKSLDNIIKESHQDLLKKIAGQIEQLERLEARISELNEEIERRYNSQGGIEGKNTLQGGIERKNTAKAKTDYPETSQEKKNCPESSKGKAAGTNLEQTSGVSKPKVKAGSYNYQPRQIKSVEEILKVYSKDELEIIAVDYGCQLHSATKKKMAFELACFMMEPKFMKARFLEFEDEELDAFEAAIEKGTFYPEEDELRNLDGFLRLKYIARFNSGLLQVPEDAAIVYTNLCRHGYREFHRKADWLLDCMEAFSQLYAVGNTDLLYKLYCQSKKMKSDREEFDSILSQIPDEISACQKIGNRIVSEDAIENGIYREIEAMQRDVPYYIPSEKEIREYAEYGYPVADPAYQSLYAFFLTDLKQDPLDCEEHCLEARYTFSAGGMLSDYVEILNSSEIVFQSKKQIEKFSRLAIQVSNNTRRVNFRGYTPNEMGSLSSSRTNGGNVVGPLAASNSRTYTQMTDVINGKTVKAAGPKIYPNDPCPCGSGKKFKKCCGRNR